MKSGVVLLKKEKGMTSFAAVSCLRRLFHEKKAGHTGTLDPDAEGLLVVCLGKATKLVPYFSEDEKTYVAELLLGRTTDTEDSSGVVLSETEVKCSAQEVADCIASFAGRQLQIPPMYSAKKVEGKRLYQLARQGVEIERKAQEVFFSEIGILSIDLPIVRFSLRCSKGAYIRTLCKDIGEKLGCGGCMLSLLRTSVGRFSLTKAHTLAGIKALLSDGREREILLPIDSFFADVRSLTVEGKEEQAVRNGNVLPASLSPVLAEREALRIYLSDGRFAGIYERRGTQLKAKSMFLEALD